MSDEINNSKPATDEMRTGSTTESRLKGLLATFAVAGGIYAAKKIFFSGEKEEPESPKVPNSDGKSRMNER